MKEKLQLIPGNSWPSVGRLFVDCRPLVDWPFAESRPTDLRGSCSSVFPNNGWTPFWLENLNDEVLVELTVMMVETQGYQQRAQQWVMCHLCHQKL